MSIVSTNLDTLSGNTTTVSINKDYYDEKSINISFDEAEKKNLLGFINAINLPKLKDPTFIATDRDSLDAIGIEIKKQYKDKYGKELVAADIDSILIDIFAYREALTRIAIQESQKQNLVQYAQGVMLDHIGRLVGVERKKESNHTIDLRASIEQDKTLEGLAYISNDDFNMGTNIKSRGKVALHRLDRYNKNIKIPKGTRVMSSDGERIYLTSQDAYIIYRNGISANSSSKVAINRPTESFVEVPVVAEYVGKGYNMTGNEYEQFSLYDTVYGLDRAVTIITYPTFGKMSSKVIEIKGETLVGLTTDFGNKSLSKATHTFTVNNTVISNDNVGYVDFKATATINDEAYNFIHRTRIDDAKPNFEFLETIYSGETLPSIIYDKIVDNISLTYGYSNEEENDDDYRKRIILAPYRYTNAGSKGAYEYHIRNTVNADELLDLKILGNADEPTINPGDVEIYILEKGDIYFQNKTKASDSELDSYSSGKSVSTEMKNILFDKINNGNIRPLTDTVKIQSLSAHNDIDILDEDVPEGVGIVVKIFAYKNSNTENVKLKATKVLHQYVADIRSKLGVDVVKSDIITRLKTINEVYHARVSFIYKGKDLVINNEIADFIRISEFQYFNYDVYNIKIDDDVTVYDEQQY